MVNFKKLADRARDVVEQQGGTDALKEKAQRMKEAASGQGSASDKAKAAAQVAREKPNQAAPTAGDDVTGGPIGGGTAPPVSADPAATPATGSPEPDPAVAPATASAADTAPSGSVGDAERLLRSHPCPRLPPSRSRHHRRQSPRTRRRRRATSPRRARSAPRTSRGSRGRWVTPASRSVLR